MNKLYYALSALLLSFTASGQISFLEPREVFSSSTGITPSATAGNLDGQDRPDLIIYQNRPSSIPNFTNFELFANDGRNDFTDTLAALENAATYILRVDDITGDGLDDLIGARSYQSRTTTDREYTQTFYPGSGTRVICTGDVDLDGDLDVLWSTINTFDTTALVLAYNDGTGQFADFDTLNTRHQMRLGDRIPGLIADLTGDGQPDILSYHYANIAWVDYDYPMQLFTLSENGGYERRQLRIPEYWDNTNIGIRGDWDLRALDLDGDEDLDLVYSNPKGLFASYNSGAGEFPTVDTLYLGTYIFQLTDLDQNGTYELLVGSDPGVVGEAEVSYIEYNANAQIPYQYENRVPIYSNGHRQLNITVAVDVDGDTDLDILTSQRLSDSRRVVYLLENDLFTPIVSVEPQPQAIPALEVFPNPTQGTTQLQLRLPTDLSRDAMLQLYTSQGQLLTSYPVAAASPQMALALPGGLPPGAYYYHLSAADGRLLAAGKIVHQ